MENSIYSLQQLFSNTLFHVPQYQRAYSWENRHLREFLEDLRLQTNAAQKNPGKKYFLGTLLLHEQLEDIDQLGFESVDIVDGQQRLTTSVVFVACALERHRAGVVSLDEHDALLLERSFVLDRDAARQKLHTIQEDEPFFQSAVLEITKTEVEPTKTTASSKRLGEARDFFRENVTAGEWSSLLKELRDAKVMVYVVNNSADATQIFELQNDRGKRLTDLEAVKSFLMHAVYLNAKNPEEKLRTISTQFAQIYRTAEELEGVEGAPGEDAVLSYYCATLPDGKDSEWRHPKELAKRRISELSTEGLQPGVLDWIEVFVAGLNSAFSSVRQILASRDHITELAELSVLNRMASFWPLLIKTYQADGQDQNKTRFKAVCRLMEIYAFRGYAISNLRSDAGQPTLYRIARESSGDFSALVEQLRDLCHWYNVAQRFSDGLNNPALYSDDSKDTRYLLWRYENNLRSRTGQQQQRLNWRDYVNPTNPACSLSIEHILPQDDASVSTDSVWNPGDPPRPIEEIALHRLGNLVLDSMSANAAKGKSEFAAKLPAFLERSTFLSQGELCGYTEERDSDGDRLWGLPAIKRRHKKLVQFALAEWEPQRVPSITD